MQSMEAVFSLVFFMAVAGAMLTEARPVPLDESVYRMQLAGDAWRVLYLRGDFTGADLSDQTYQEKIRNELELLESGTSLCFFVSGTDLSNCAGGKPKEEVAVLRRTMLDGGSPRAITFSVQR